jgi:hypothetical protein
MRWKDGRRMIVMPRMSIVGDDKKRYLLDVSRCVSCSSSVISASLALTTHYSWFRYPDTIIFILFMSYNYCFYMIPTVYCPAPS